MQKNKEILKYILTLEYCCNRTGKRKSEIKGRPFYYGKKRKTAGGYVCKWGNSISQIEKQKKSK